MMARQKERENTIRTPPGASDPLSCWKTTYDASTSDGIPLRCAASCQSTMSNNSIDRYCQTRETSCLKSCSLLSTNPCVFFVSRKIRYAIRTYNPLSATVLVQQVRGQNEGVLRHPPPSLSKTKMHTSGKKKA